MATSFINKKADLTTTDLTTLYTVPSARTAVVKSILVSEDAGSGSSSNIAVTLVDSSVEPYLVYLKTKASSIVIATTELLNHSLLLVQESEVQ